jgi:hypothetical protein
MTPTASRQWYDRQNQRDRDSCEKSEALLGPEQAIFHEAMSLLLGLSDAVVGADDASERLESVNFQHKVAVVHYGYNLLWAAWREALAGRYQTATDHLRSIQECPEFLLALSLNPALSEDWTDNRPLDIGTDIRRTIRREFDTLGASAGADLVKRMRGAAKDVQSLSHVSIQSLRKFLPLVERHGQRVLLVRLGGAVSETTLRRACSQLASSAVYILGIALVVFKGVVVGRELSEAVTAKTIEYQRVLTEQLKTIAGESSAEVTYFAASVEPV